MIGPREIRACRAWLGWSQSRLAKEARISRSAVARAELDEVTPQPETVERILRAFRRRGVEIVERPGGRIALLRER